MLELGPISQDEFRDHTEKPVDQDFIVNFLTRYFPDRSREELADSLAEIMRADRMRGLRVGSCP